MESRLRKFINQRREKLAVSSKNDSDVQSGSSRSASLHDLTPLSIFHSMTRSNTDKAKTLPIADLASHSVPYERTPAGAAPVFGTGPLKGNGPVKLQASRRLSSGELLANPQDGQPTLEGILEGDYIMGGKSRRESSARSLRSPALPSIITSTGRRSSTPYSPRSPSVASKSSVTFHPNTNPEPMVRCLDTPASSGLGISTNVPPTWTTAGLDQPENSPSTISSISKFPGDPEMPHSYLAPIDEQNATIAALWKAEYSRLVRIYGQDGVQRNIAKMNTGHGRLSVPPSIPSGDQHRLSIVLDPLPRPKREKASCDLRRTSDMSGLSSIYRDDDSDASSNKRVSLISSCAGSSAHTTNTTQTDHETVVTRDDIRKIIDDMRTTYLRAFEARTSSVPTPSHGRRKKRRAKAGSPNVDSRPNAGEPGRNRQTWHAHVSDNSDATSNGQRKNRVVSQTVTGFGRLSPVEDSPTRGETRPIRRLQRADSGTLGSIMASIDSDRALEVDAIHDHESTKSRSQQMDLEKPSLVADSVAISLKAKESESSLQHISTRPTGNFF